MLYIKERDRLDLEIDSAGLISDHVGDAPDTRTMANAEKHGVDLSSLRARQFTKQDFERFDQIFVMDTSNKKRILHPNVSEHNQAKVKLLLACLPGGEMKGVPDPYHGTEKDFENVYQLINLACEILSNSLKAGKSY